MGSTEGFAGKRAKSGSRIQRFRPPIQSSFVATLTVYTDIIESSWMSIPTVYAHFIIIIIFNNIYFLYSANFIKCSTALNTVYTNKYMQAI